MRQDEALNLMKMGNNIFLTGAPGSGKTYLLNKYIHYLREHNIEVAVTASTGIAATHLQGITIHSWSGIGIKDKVTEEDLEKLRATKLIKRNYEKTKVLIIDEISMLHKHQLDMIDSIARYILSSAETFGGMQVILCGDFFQLPPVSSSSLTQKKHFAFEALAWENGNLHVCYLHEQYRQGDDPLLTILQDIRSGTAGEQTKIPLRTRYKKEPEGTTKATKLYSRNINVDGINESELLSIRAEEKTFDMVSEGVSALVHSLKKSCLAQETLKLKIGAEVIFIKNDTGGKYVNGTRGIVVGFDKSSKDYPIVKTYDNRSIIAHPEEWKYEEGGIVRATITQVPLRLAWAITIHKSQGMTLDAAEIDLSDAFEPGMGYVALSRVRSLNGLKLMGLNEIALKVHPQILQQDKIFKDSANVLIKYLQTLSEKEKGQSQRETLIDRFGGCTSKATGKKINKGGKQRSHTYRETLELLKKNISIESIAEKCGFSVDTIINHIEKLRDLKQLDDSYISHLKNEILETDFDIIFSELNKSEDGRLKSIYEKFEGKYSYKDIKIVRFFLKER